MQAKPARCAAPTAGFQGLTGERSVLKRVITNLLSAAIAVPYSHLSLYHFVCYFTNDLTSSPSKVRSCDCSQLSDEPIRLACLAGKCRTAAIFLPCFHPFHPHLFHKTFTIDKISASRPSSPLSSLQPILKWDDTFLAYPNILLWRHHRFEFHPRFFPNNLGKELLLRYRTLSLSLSCVKRRTPLTTGLEEALLNRQRNDCHHSHELSIQNRSSCSQPRFLFQMLTCVRMSKSFLATHTTLNTLPKPDPPDRLTATRSLSSSRMSKTTLAGVLQVWEWCCRISCFLGARVRQDKINKRDSYPANINTTLTYKLLSSQLPKFWISGQRLNSQPFDFFISFMSPSPHLKSLYSKLATIPSQPYDPKLRRILIRSTAKLHSFGLCSSATLYPAPGDSGHAVELPIPAHALFWLNARLTTIQFRSNLRLTMASTTDKSEESAELDPSRVVSSNKT